jgi:ABC-type nitrate/sulfonate/bicarbonate transport system substrate-binding protein
MTSRLAWRRSRRAAAALTSAVALLALAACGSSDHPGTAADSSAASLTEVTLALGWSPNTDYTGIYVADSKGYFAKQGIKVKIIPYASTAPETLIAHGKADFGFSYQAGVAYARAAGQDVVSVFAPDQKGTYAIGVRSDRKDIVSPRDLDGRTYAGFGTPDELPELRYVIRQDGGTGTFRNVTLNTSAYDAVYTGKADFTITVATWEAIEAKLVGKPLTLFQLTDYGFPDQYSTLIATSRSFLDKDPDRARGFLAAVDQGYAFAADHPRDAAKIVIDENPSVFANPDLVYQSEAALAAGGYLRNSAGQVGNQNTRVWTSYLDFLYANGLLVDADGKKLTAKPDWSAYYTNEYLPAGSR